MNDLELARETINQIDRDMADLFALRMRAVEKIAAYKKERGIAIRDKKRENELFEKNSAFITDEVIRSYYMQFIKDTVDLSCRYQLRLMEGMKVAFCGETGAYAELASLRMYPSAKLIAYDSFGDAYRAVENGDTDVAVLPLENSSAGDVTAVTDLMYGGSLFVNRVCDFAIRHCLLTVPGADLEKIRTVISHPQALAQCAGYLKAHGYHTSPSSNTAVAAKTVAECGDPTVAAIASAECAAMFGLTCADKAIEDNPSNRTRFAAFSRVRSDLPPANRSLDHFVLMFTVEHKAGALAQMLNIVGSHGYNMYALRSRPLKGAQWNYYFYLEAEGNIHNQNGRELLQELQAICAELKLIGSFHIESYDSLEA